MIRKVEDLGCEYAVNIALRSFLHNHGNIATDRGSPKSGLCPTLNNE